MNLEEKNQHYHNIFNILSDDNYSAQQKAQSILLYLENLLKEQEIQFKEAQDNHAVSGHSPANFKGLFRRST
jgi:hypothetical protein